MYSEQLTTYHRGLWVERPNPLAQLSAELLGKLSPGGLVNAEAEYGAVDYVKATDLTRDGEGAITLRVWVLRVSERATQDGPPRYIVQPTIGAESHVPDPVGAMDTIDVLDLLARWAPALTASAYLEDARTP